MKKKLLLILVVMILTGCSSVERTGGESLSSAMNKSRSSNPSDRVVDDGEEEGSFFGNLLFDIIFGGSSSDDNGSSVTVRNNSSNIEVKKLENGPNMNSNSNSDCVFAVGHGRSFYSGKDISEMENLTFSIKVAGPENSGELGLGLIIGDYRLKNNFEYKDSIESGIILGIEGKGNGCIKRIGKYAGINAGGGMSINYLTWDYKNPLYSDTTIITDDNIGFVKFFGTMGIDFRKKDTIYLNIEAIPEIILTAEDTRGGFRNDVFKNHFGIGYRLEIGQTF